MIKALILLLVLSLVSCVHLKDLSASKKGEALNLSKQGLTSIPDYVFEKKEITVLRLFGNELDSISERIGELENLEKLYLGKNNLKSLPTSIGNLKKLKILSVQYNDLEKIPNEISDLANLEQLLLNQNNLKTLPKSIGNLKKLERLELKFNSLVSLPNEIGDCENLRFVYLNRNNIDSLPSSFGQLERLKEIYLSGAGPLLDVPEAFCDLRNLEILEIDPAVAIPPCLLVLQANRLEIILH